MVRRATAGLTIADVARHAGVSAMTVSRVINGSASVRPAVRGRVEQAIAALDYAPNEAARRLAGAARLRIALLHDNPSRAWLSEVLLGCLAEATRCDIQLLIERGPDAADKIAAAGVDGVILPPPVCEDRVVRDCLQKAGLPVVLLAGGDNGAGLGGGVWSARINDEQAAFDMTAELLALGHRRIGFVRGSPDQSASARRFAGFRRALSAAGVELDPSLVAQGDFTFRSGLQAAERLLPEQPSAIFASNDDMAAACIAVAQRCGLSVPGALSVCGFDDTALATAVFPELTTVRQPVESMARAAMDMVVGAVRARRADMVAEGEQRVFPHEIVRRGSVGVRS